MHLATLRELTTIRILRLLRDVRKVEFGIYGRLGPIILTLESAIANKIST